jgi:hypothetical protein
MFRFNGNVRIVLLKPIGTMPDSAINFLLIEAVGQNRAGKDRDCVDRGRLPGLRPARKA